MLAEKVAGVNGGVQAIGVVLAGGLGSRLGQPKSRALLGGQPLAAYPLAALRAAGLHVVGVAKDDRALEGLDCETLLEPVLPRHPLCGIVAALRTFGSPLVVCGCDMPFVPTPLLAELAGLDAPLAVVSAKRGLQPLLGRYDPTLADALRARMEEEASLQRTVRELGAIEVDAWRFGDPERVCFNVNTPEDLRTAEGMLER